MTASRRITPQAPGTLRHDRKLEIAYVALADYEEGGVVRSVLVVAPGLLEARGIPPEREEAAQLRVDLDGDGRVYGIEVLWSTAQLPRACEADPKGEDTVLDIRPLDDGDGVRVLLGAEDDTATTVPVPHVVGDVPPRLAFDAEGRLVALDVAVPGAIDAEVSFVDAGNEDNSYSPWLALEHDLLDYRGEPLIPRDDTAVEDCD